MNSCAAILLVTLLSQSPTDKAPADIQLEPCFQFEIEGSATIKGKVEKDHETVFTAAELPWAKLGIVDRSNLEVGFDAKEEAAEFEFAGKKAHGKKLTWNRKPNTAFNVSAAAVHCWVLSAVDVPSYNVQFGRQIEFRLPPGCVKVEVVPHDKNAKGIDEWEKETSVAVSGTYKRPTTYKLGENILNAHEMVFTVATGEHKGTITYTVSSEMPGGLCAMEVDGNVSGAFGVTAMTPVAPPQNLDYFPKQNFAFAPPAGYTKSTTPTDGEVVRYVKGNDFLAVTVIELGKGGLPELEREILEKNKYDLEYTGNSRYHHLAGHRSFNASHVKTRVLTIVTDHAGRAYLLSTTALDTLLLDETRDFLKRWRWIVAVDR